MKILKHAFLILLLAASAAGCAPKSIDDYHTGENQEEIVRLLNQREYAKAIWLVESKNGKTPADPKIAFLLGQAYLGKAEFEPLRVAARVSGAQIFSSQDALDLFPKCSSEALSHGNKTDVVCLLKRVYLQVPDADLADFTRARELFRSAYPDAAASPEWVNVLIGMVETASCVKRAGKIFLFAKRLGESKQQPSDDQLKGLLVQVKRAIHEADEALKRADHSGNKISQLLTGEGDTVFFRQVKDGAEWADETSFRELFELFRENFVSPSDEAKYRETLDRIRKILEDQEKLVHS